MADVGYLKGVTAPKQQVLPIEKGGAGRHIIFQPGEYHLHASWQIPSKWWMIQSAMFFGLFKVFFYLVPW